MANIPEELLLAAGFTGASAGQAIQSGQARAAIQTNQNTLGGVQERRGISDAAESRGMLRSTMTTTQLGEQSAEQANKQQLIDLGLSDTISGANIDVMQELAQQQAQAEAQAYEREQADRQYLLDVAKLDLESKKAGVPINYAAGSKTAGTNIDPKSPDYRTSRGY